METCPAILSTDRIDGCIGASELFLYLFVFAAADGDAADESMPALVISGKGHFLY